MGVLACVARRRSTCLISSRSLIAPGFCLSTYHSTRHNSEADLRNHVAIAVTRLDLLQQGGVLPLEVDRAPRQPRPLLRSFITQ